MIGPDEFDEALEKAWQKGFECSQREAEPQKGCSCGSAEAPIYVVEGVPMMSLQLDEDDPDHGKDFDFFDCNGEVRIGLEVCRGCHELIGCWVESSTAPFAIPGAHKEQIAQLQAENAELKHDIERALSTNTELLAEAEKLQAENAELQKKTASAMGVGDGSGLLIVYGDHDSIKAAQGIVFRCEEQAAQVARLQAERAGIPQFLFEMSQQMREQDNRCTSHPFWQVRCKRHIPTEEGYSDVGFELITDDGDIVYRSYHAEDDELEQLLIEDYPEFCEQLRDEAGNGETVEDALAGFDPATETLPDGLRIHYVQEIEEVVSTHLTEQDAKWFIRRKQHDYPTLYTYVESAYWSPQLRELQDWIISLTAPTTDSEGEGNG